MLRTKVISKSVRLGRFHFRGHFIIGTVKKILKIRGKLNEELSKCLISEYY